MRSWPLGLFLFFAADSPRYGLPSGNVSRVPSLTTFDTLVSASPSALAYPAASTSPVDNNGVQADALLALPWCPSPATIAPVQATSAPWPHGTTQATPKWRRARFRWPPWHLPHTPHHSSLKWFTKLHASIRRPGVPSPGKEAHPATWNPGQSQQPASAVVPEQVAPLAPTWKPSSLVP